jgi:hypothetical protein
MKGGRWLQTTLGHFSKSVRRLVNIRKYILFYDSHFLASVPKCYLRNTKIIAIILSSVTMLLLLLLTSPLDEVVLPLKQWHVFSSTSIIPMARNPLLLHNPSFVATNGKSKVKLSL